MLGAILIALVVILVLPGLFIAVGTAFAMLTGWLLQSGVESDHEGSELVATNY